MKKTIPTFFKTLTLFLLTFWCTLALARLAMLGILWADLSSIEPAAILKAFYTGIKFDGRIAVFLSIPLAILLALPFFEKRLPQLVKGLAIFYFVVFFALALLYVVDFGFYFYLNQRLDATILDLMAENDLSFNMVLETYPVFWIALALIVFSSIIFYFTKTNLQKHKFSPLGWKKRTAWGFGTFVLLFLIAYAQLSSNFFPLRWSNAYFHTSQHIPILAINPVQNLYDSMHSRKAILPDMQAVKEAYPNMKSWLNLPDSHTDLNFLRVQPGNNDIKPFNIVIIIMESLGTPRTSLWEGLQAEVQYDPTPNLRLLANESLYFSWFFAPARTTARAIFSFITGIPDVNRTTGTTSRNPALVDQTTVFSEFHNYSKSYMIGGSANWANIRGILLYNIPGLKLLEEGHWKSSNIDVWGISDLDLFREGIEFLRTEQTPFIAAIQTAGFHRPWTIPKDNAEFEDQKVPAEVLAYYGFVAQEEYTSMRFSDHALGEFFRLAKQEPWFDNTVFVIFGDHGLTASSTNATAAYLNSNLHPSHVPLLFYAPGRPDLFTPAENPMPAGSPDVLPTLAKLAGLEFYNQTLGRDLLDEHTQKNARQFIAGDDERFRRLVEDGYCYVLAEQEALYKLNDPSGENLIEKEPERAAKMRQHAKDAFVTSKFMIFNNKKQTKP